MGEVPLYNACTLSTILVRSQQNFYSPAQNVYTLYKTCALLTPLLRPCAKRSLQYVRFPGRKSCSSRRPRPSARSPNTSLSSMRARSQQYVYAPNDVRTGSYPWSPFPPRRARPGPGPHKQHAYSPARNVYTLYTTRTLLAVPGTKVLFIS